MSSKNHKAEIRELLKRRDFEELKRWGSSVRNLQRVLLSLAYDIDDLVRWRSIEAIGKVAKIQAESDLEKVRDLIRRLLWLMNDESGGVGWHSPEIIGEILVNVPSLIDEYGELLLAYLKEEPFEKGSHLAIYRVASINPKPYIKRVAKLAESLNESDPMIRLYTAMALEKIEPKKYQDAIEKLLSIESSITLYDFETGLLKEVMVKQIIQQILDRVNSFYSN
jgi:hypothetical protein